MISLIAATSYKNKSAIHQTDCVCDSSSKPQD
jgi:hypothetical protein